MKKILFLFFILAFTGSFASNLEFSQVILIDATAAFSRTVPANKVWEIRSAPPAINTSYLLVNGITTPLVNKGSSSDFGFNVLPFWAPAGTVLSNGSLFPSGYYSIIEYNVVP